MWSSRSLYCPLHCGQTNLNWKRKFKQCERVTVGLNTLLTFLLLFSFLTVPHLSYLTVLHLSPTWLSSISLLPDCSPSLSYLTVLRLSPTWLSSCCSACGPPSPVVWGMFSHSEDRTFSAPGWVRSRLVTAAQRNGVEKVRNRALHYKHYD